MASFPKSEPRIAALAETVAAGLASHDQVYPAPPVTPGQLSAILDEYTAARSEVLAAQAACERATADKNAKLAALVTAVKTDLRYAENTAQLDDEKLKLIGWAAKRRPSMLEVPGQSRLLKAVQNGDLAAPSLAGTGGRLELTWKRPIDGGKPSAYRIVRRQLPDGPWQDVAVAVATGATLSDQPRAVDLEYRIIAVNRTGPGQPSNTICVIL
jgi:multidrug efflux pump subunit AcrA (membrane-fusion protein)